MSQLDDLERELRDALVTLERTAPPPGLIERLITQTEHSAQPTTRRGLRTRRVFLPALAAAAVAVLVLIIAIATSRSGGNHSAPAVTISPRPATTSSVPTATDSASTSPTERPTSSGPTTLPAAGPRTKPLAVAVGGATVRLTVPTDWRVSDSQPHACCDTPATTCLVRGSQEYGGNVENCVLAVTVERRPHQLGISPDYPRPADTTCGSWTTTAESDPPIQGRPGEYRRFHNGCTGTDSEQWTTMSEPQVVFWHPITPVSSHAAVAHLVETAGLPAVTDSQRQFDEGYIRSMSRRGGAYYVQIDRVVLSLDGSITNLNPATYTYRLTSSYATTGGIDPCGSRLASCGIADVFAQFKMGPHPADGSFAVDGAYVQLSAFDGAHQLLFIQPRKLN